MPSSLRISPHFIGDVGILAAHQLRSRLDDRHAAPEATISLGQFETDIAGAKHDQMRRQVVELESLDVRERPGGLEAGNARNRRMRADIEEHLVARQHAGPAVIETAPQASSALQMAGPHDQFGAARLVVLANAGQSHARPCLACAGELSPCRS